GNPSPARPMDGPGLPTGSAAGRKSGGPRPDLPRNSDDGRVPPRPDWRAPRARHLAPSASRDRGRPHGRTRIWLGHWIPRGFRDRDVHRPRGPPGLLGRLGTGSSSSEPGSYRRELVVPRFPPRPVTLRNRSGILLLPRASTGRPRRLAPRHRRDLARLGTHPRDSRPTDASLPPSTNRGDRRPRGVGTLQRDPVGRARHRPHRPGPTRSRSIPLVRGARFNRRVHQPRRGAASSPSDRVAVPSPPRDVLPHAADRVFPDRRPLAGADRVRPVRPVGPARRDLHPPGRGPRFPRTPAGGGGKGLSCRGGWWAGPMRKIPKKRFLDVAGMILRNKMAKEAIYPFYCSFKLTRRCNFTCS